MNLIWKVEAAPWNCGESGMPNVNIIGHLSEKLFLSNLKAKNKDQVLKELIDLYVAEKIIRNREIVLKMLKQRETLGSTGLGKGVAIPHGRTTAAPEVLIAFGKSERGIDFDAIDKKHVHLFFMIIAPPNDKENTYLPVLGSLVTKLNSASKRKKLRKVTSFEELVSALSEEQ
jgi:fructose-specific phosphotransferase system IIA component